MTVRDLIPWGRQNASTAPTVYREDETSPFLSLQRQVNRLFDDVFRDFGAPSLFSRAPNWPSIEVHDSEKDVRVAAELPGLEEKDIEVLLEGDVLTIRGEKHAEIKDNDRHFTERSYGRFERRIALGFEAEDDKVSASFKNGVLTVMVPKTGKAQTTVKRIAIGHKT